MEGKTRKTSAAETARARAELDRELGPVSRWFGEIDASVAVSPRRDELYGIGVKFPAHMLLRPIACGEI